MCTVSYIFSNNQILITHNRDEKVLRPNAIEPLKYQYNNKSIFFPKDTKAGGTWYAVSENGTVLVLLNGAKEKHIPKNEYRKSRGLIVLDLISSDDPLEEWNSIDLNDIEPFTIVFFQQNTLYQLQWNGKQKDTKKLNPKEKYIWSSSTLYNKNVREERENLFQNFIENDQDFVKNVFKFHRYSNHNDLENGLIINRNNEIKTLSITQTIIENFDIKISYLDLEKNKESTITFTANQTSKA